MEDRRDSPRVQFPVDIRARLFARGQAALILDCSPVGLRYELPAGVVPPNPGDWISGTVRLADGTDVDVSGSVLRITGREVALELVAPGLPSSLLQESFEYVARPA